MKPIDKNEIYDHLNHFLKGRGIELKAGSYADRIQQGCSILADSINLGQEGVERAQEGINKNLERLRQVIHERTAPRSSAPPPRSQKPAAKPPVIVKSASKKPGSRTKPKAPKSKR